MNRWQERVLQLCALSLLTLVPVSARANFNSQQFDLPNAAIGASNAGTITSIVGTTRQIQLGLKLVCWD